MTKKDTNQENSPKAFKISGLGENIESNPQKSWEKNSCSLSAGRQGVVMPRVLLLIPFLFGVLFTAGNPLAASSGSDHDLDHIAQKADWICEVEILSKEAVMLANGTIETRFVVSTLTPMKGTMSRTEEIRIPGGEVAGRGMMLPGMPEFEVGERHILFLTEKNDKQWRMPVDFSKGTARVSMKASGEQVVIQGGHEGTVQVQSYNEYVQRVFQAIG